ncbi:hypothetical protein [Thermococcus sp.]|uniref:hypothetical protein n=1 Tax=Thermococcus sp. TaxID=35749 RepID=UPI00262C3688|nr:hypothetical protein [Thermococcus sp.]
MSGLESAIGLTVGWGLGFLFGIIVLLYGAAKKQLARGFLGFILTILGSAILGAMIPAISIIAPIIIVAVLIRWIAGNVEKSRAGHHREKPEEGGLDSENNEKLEKTKNKYRFVKYALGAIAVLIILSIIAGGSGERNYYYTCPADKYKLTTSDFDESGWRIKEVSESQVEYSLFKYGELSNYKCKATGKALKVDIFGEAFLYGIYIFDNEEQAQAEFNKLRQQYLEKVSIDKNCGLGDECFKYSGASYEWRWIRESNAIIGVFGTGLGVEYDMADFGEIILKKMHKTETN